MHRSFARHAVRVTSLHRLTPCRPGVITLEPSSGEVPATAGDGGHGLTVITAVLNVESTGTLAGDIGIIVDGGTDAKKLTFCATGVKHHFELLESSGAVVSEVRAGRLPESSTALHAALRVVHGGAS